jgi:hypothetical protein
MAKKINYFARNFVDVRTELFNFIKQYYPDLFSDFNDASVGTMLVELNAATADMLSYHTDRMFQETQIDYAQERKSVMSMARTFGLKVPGQRPSVTIVDFSVTLPPLGDTWDQRYAPKLRYGAQVLGGGQSFESVEDIDFSSPYSSGGIPNRLILPNIDVNGNLLNYTIVKRELVINGSTKVYKRPIDGSDVKPFLEIVLPDTNVISVESIITKEGTNLTTTPTLDEFIDFDNRWWEMDSLAEDKVFIEDTTRNSDNSGIKMGKWVNTTQRFIKEFTDNGFCKITFGSGNADEDLLTQFGRNAFTQRIGDFINTTALGEIPKANNTLFIRYRVGGGSSSNVGANVINNVGINTMTIKGPNPNTNDAVRRSLRVNNPIPAFGGAGSPSTEMVRQMTKYNFAAQNRAVTIKDYLSRIQLMPGKFGVPFRLGVSEDQNKVEVYILGLDSKGKLSNSSTNALKENIASYLADYRMLNDYVLVGDGRIINVSFELDLFVDKSYNEAEIVNNVIQNVKDYMDVNNWEMGDTIYLGQLTESVSNVGGVINVTDVRVYNEVGGGEYSLNEISQAYSTTPVLVGTNTNNRQVDLTEDYALFGEHKTMFEIKFPSKDIRIRIKSASV